jgi:hypothetical protein
MITIHLKDLLLFGSLGLLVIGFLIHTFETIFETSSDIGYYLIIISFILFIGVLLYIIPDFFITNWHKFQFVL